MTNQYPATNSDRQNPYNLGELTTLNNAPILTINGDFTYQQIGSDIDGEALGDESGYSVSLSVDGSVVAIGAPYNDGNGTRSGHVRIYKNQNGVWTQVGSDIDGEATGDQSGYSVSLSADGSLVAIGARLNDGNGTSSGHVRIYKNQNGVWTQVGSDIDGEAENDSSGRSISLSADGSVVAIGAPYNDGNGQDSGHARIYQNVNGVWTQIGNDIDGEATGDQSGRSVSLSADGSVVAISTPLNDNDTSVDFRNGGHARIYQNVNGIWTQIGDDIDGNFIEDLGASVSLSSDGSVVAIGSRDGRGFVRVYENINGTWTQIGDSIYGEASPDNSGHSVSLSADGSVVAIGAPDNDGNGQDSGHVRIYENQNGVWTQIGDDIDGEWSSDNSGHSVSLSADGSVVAIGAPDNDGEGNGNSGHVRIYQIVNTVTVEENQTAVTTATATDPDGTTPVYSLGGADGDLFNIDSNGVITFKVAPDYENPGDVGADNIYNVIVTATDEVDSNLSTSQSLAIEVSDVIREPINRAPVLTINSNYRTYEQIGDFNGSGRSVSLSADGSVAAIGSSIYRNIDGIWSFLNSSTSGTGPSVLSADGSVIASGIPSANAKGSNTGVVRIYEIVDDTSTLVGYIEGEAAGDISGTSVSLSADGYVVAIGAPWNDDNGFQSGHVRIYENQNGVLTWTQIGDDIDGEVTLDVAGDESGTSVSLSADGSVVAIGAPYNDGSGFVSEGRNKGHVRVYENINGVWTQVGDDIDGEAEFNYSGTSVSLSADGSVVAIGARGNSDNGQFSGHVRVYENVNGVWTQIGDDIDGEGAGDGLGTSVSLSADGSVVVIGAEYNDGNGQDSGHARIYENVNGVWTQIGDDIDGEEAGDRLGYSVSLSADGSVTAIGGYSSGVRIYQIIDNVTVAENQTMVTTATATDPDLGAAKPLYSLSGADASLFSISTNGVITFNTAPDYENPGDVGADNTYNLIVTATDGLNANLSANKSLVVKVIGVNDNSTPTGLSLSQTNIDENVAVGTVIGTFTTTDPDTGETFTYRLIAGIGDTDNSLFTIDGDVLKTNAVFDFETKDTYTIRVQTTDSANNTYSESFTININDVLENEGDRFEPNNIPAEATILTPINGTIEELNLSIHESQDEDFFQFTLENLATESHFIQIDFEHSLGDLDLTLYQRLEGGVSVEVDTSESVTNQEFISLSGLSLGEYSVKVYGYGGETNPDYDLTINLPQNNTSPTDINLSNDTVNENEPINTTVGTFTTTDLDIGDTFAYGLVAGEGDTANSLFIIEGDTLKTNDVFDFESQATYSIRVQTTDSANNTYSESFTINIGDVAEDRFGQDIINENDDFVSLREAIIAANNTTSDITITLEEGAYRLDIEGKDEDSAATGDLDITLQDYTVTIQGQGKDKTILDANNIDRFLEINTGATVILSGVTIIGGAASVGGAIANKGHLTIIDSNLQNNQALGSDGSDGTNGSRGFPSGGNPRKGGDGTDGTNGEDAYGGGVFNSGTLIIQNSELSNNQALGGDGGDGGNGGEGSYASLSGAPYAPAVGGNGGDGGDGGDAKGGGIYNSGQVRLTDVVIDGNTIIAGSGGAAGIGGLGGRRTDGSRTSSGFNGVSGNDGIAQGESIYNSSTGTILSNQNLSGVYNDGGSFEVGDSFSPNDISLDNNTVDENEPINTTVGTFTTTDLDIEDTFTYGLVAGEGDTDNSLFTLDGDTLKTNAVFDFESQATYSIRVQTTDSANNTYSESFTISVNNVNEIPPSEEFKIHTNVNYGATDPSVTALNNGNFVVAWESYTDFGSGIYGQIFNANGSLVGGELHFNLLDEFDYQEASVPEIAPLANGNFVVSWRGYNDLGYQVQSRIFDSQGNGLSDEFATEIYNLNITPPAIAPLNNGNFIIVGDHEISWDDHDIEGQIIDQNGNLVGNQITINTHTDQSQSNPSVTTLSNGNFVVVWESWQQDGDDLGIFGQRFDSNGNPLGNEFQVNSYTDNEQSSPDIAATNNGFMVTWESFGQDGDVDGIFGQRFDNNGNPLGGEFQINTYTNSDQTSPDIAATDNGFVVTWESFGQDGDSLGVFGQSFDSDGNFIGEEFQVNTFTENDQFRPSVAVTQNAQMIVAWQSYGQDGFNDGIYGKRFPFEQSNPNKPPTDLNLSNLLINENEPINTTVGTFTTVDPDANETFTYTLVAGVGDTDNSLFTLEGDILKTNAIFDFESQDTYSIRVQTTDSANNTYSESFTININDIDEPIDLVAQSFDVVSDHVLGGEVTVDFTITNQGLGNADSFNLQFVYSDDDIIGNEDDIVVDTLTVEQLLSGDNYTNRHPLQLPLASLNTHALNDDPPNLGNGYISESYDYLGVIIDADNQIPESDELNNYHQGQGIDKDDITYFPWDLDGNGVVTSTDAIFAINRIGQTITQDNSLADLNGDGIISSTDAISIINRIGYQINQTVMEDESISEAILPTTVDI